MQIVGFAPAQFGRSRRSYCLKHEPKSIMILGLKINHLLVNWCVAALQLRITALKTRLGAKPLEPKTSSVLPEPSCSHWNRVQCSVGEKPAPSQGKGPSLQDIAYSATLR